MIKKLFNRISMVLLWFLKILVVNFIWLMVLLKIFIFHTVAIWLIVRGKVLWSLRIVASSLIGILFFYFAHDTELELFIIVLVLWFAITSSFDWSSGKVTVSLIFWIYCCILWKIIIRLIITHQKSTDNTKINFLFFIKHIRTLYIFLISPIIIFLIFTLQIIFNINSLLLLAKKLNLSFYIIIILIIILFFIVFLAFPIELYIINLDC